MYIIWGVAIEATLSTDGGKTMINTDAQKRKPMNEMHKLYSRRRFLMMMVVGSMMLSACGMEAVTKTPTAYATSTPAMTETYGGTIEPTGVTTEVPTETTTPISTETPTTMPTEAGTPTEVTVPTEYKMGEYMTPEQLKVNIDWFYNMSNAELNALVQGNLWSYKGVENFELKTWTANDLGFLAKEKGTTLTIYSYNAMYLGTTGTKDSEHQFLVSAYGIKDFQGNRLVIYGADVVSSPLEDYHGYCERAAKDNDNRIFMDRDLGEGKQEKFIYDNLNNHLKDIVILDLHVLNENFAHSNELRNYVSTFSGGVNLYDSLMKQKEGDTTVTAKSIFDERIPVTDNLIRSEYTVGEMTNFAYVTAVCTYNR